MHIAQVAPLYESVPPQGYGGTERIVSYLTEELVQRGHDVTLFATGDSMTRAHLVAPCERALRQDEAYLMPEVYHMLMLEYVYEYADRFDLIHFHTGNIHFPLLKHLRTPHVTTMHGRLDLADLVPLFQVFPTVPVVSISDAQRRPLPWLNWQRTVYHGLPEQIHTPGEAPGDYLLFLGRISPEKRVDRAVEIARETGRPLKVAAKVDPVDQQYFEEKISPLFDDPLVDFLGEVGGKEKNDLLGGAYALLFPIDWPEPFGLVMIEAFACGTPVIAYRRGSVPEVMRDGVSGFVVDTQEEAVQAVKQVGQLDRQACRRYFEECFTAPVMCEAYLEVYESLLDAHPSRSVRSALPGAAANGISQKPPLRRTWK